MASSRRASPVASRRRPECHCRVWSADASWTAESGLPRRELWPALMREGNRRARDELQPACRLHMQTSYVLPTVHIPWRSSAYPGQRSPVSTSYFLQLTYLLLSLLKRKARPSGALHRMPSDVASRTPCHQRGRRVSRLLSLGTRVDEQRACVCVLSRERIALLDLVLVFVPDSTGTATSCP